EDALQEARLPVLDDRDRREDRREEEHEPDDAGIEVLHGADVGRRPGRAEGRAEAAAQQHPEDERLREGADQAAPLAHEADDLPPPEGLDGGEGRAAHDGSSATASSLQKRWPVSRTKTSSSVGRPNVAESISPGKASTTSRTNSCPRGSSTRSTPSTRRASRP